MTDPERAAVALASARNLFWALGRAEEADAALRDAERRVTDPALRHELAAQRVRLAAAQGRRGGGRGSRREREIALLAGAGGSSREIADRLVLSVRTVDNHLQNAYRKLGVTRRQDLPGVLSGTPEADLP